MKYLAKRNKWKLEIDHLGARVKRTVWVDLDIAYGCNTDQILVELVWGDTFKDLDREI